MRNFILVADGTKKVMTESKLVMTGYILSGTIGLVESLEGFRSVGYDIIVDDSKVQPYVLNESAALLEGFLDDAKAKLKVALEKVKAGAMSEDSFDKMYNELKAQGKTSSGDRSTVGQGGSSIGNTAASFGSRSGASATVSSRPLSNTSSTSTPSDKADVPKLEGKKLEDKIAGYEKLFKSDISKYKKLLEIAPQMAERFKAEIDALTGANNAKYASLAEGVEGIEDDVKPDVEVPEPKEPTEPEVKKTKLAWGDKELEISFKGNTVTFGTVTGIDGLKEGDTAELNQVSFKIKSGDKQGGTYTTGVLTKTEAKPEVKEDLPVDKSEVDALEALPAVK